MSNSIQVKEWRKRFKQKIVDAFGGQCAMCGYKKCNEVFHCHHLDPSQKEFSLSQIMSNPQKWAMVVPELRKCVMLCSNCHGEVHAGVTQVPSTITKFDETFAIEKKSPASHCPICSKEIPNYRITCSLECAAKKSRTVDWDNVDLNDLYVKQQVPQIHIASMLGCSAAAVRKRLKKLNLL